MIPRSHSHKPSGQRERDPEGSEHKQADLNALNVLGDIPAPTTAVDATLDDGFHLDNGVKIRNGDGALLVGGEAFAWRPWLKRPSGSKAEMINKKGQFELDEEVWGLLGLVWPRPGEFFIPPRVRTGFRWLILMGWACCRFIDYWNGGFYVSAFSGDQETH